MRHSSKTWLVMLIMVMAACDEEPQTLVLPPDPEPLPDTVLSAYPIHIIYREEDDVPEFIKPSIKKAVADWSELLQPTDRSPFTFTSDFTTVSHANCKVTHRSGTVLDPGLHLIVRYTSEENARGAAWACTEALTSVQYGTSDVPTVPVAVVGIVRNWADRLIEAGRGEEVKSTVYDIMRHELGHVFGIGTGPRWRSQMTRTRQIHGRSYGAVFPDTVATAVFSELVGSDFPVHTPKVGIDGVRHHWDPCLGIPDLMKSGNLITALTARSLREGYEVKPSLIQSGPIDRSAWNQEHASYRCVNGQFIPRPTGAAQDAAPFENGMIWDLAILFRH